MERDEIVRILIECDVPVAPVNTVHDIFNCPQVKTREMLVEIEHPIAGLLKIAGIPAKLSGTPGRIKTAAPLLGKHTDEILKGLLGYDDDKIQELREEKVI
jgi:CoA:oxalate CoA-transferase